MIELIAIVIRRILQAERVDDQKRGDIMQAHLFANAPGSVFQKPLHIDVWQGAILAQVAPVFAQDHGVGRGALGHGHLFWLSCIDRSVPRIRGHATGLFLAGQRHGMSRLCYAAI